MVSRTTKKVLPVMAGAVFMAGLSSFTILNGASASAAPVSYDNVTRYQSDLEPLNRSEVYGNAKINFDGTDLQVKIRASGLEPNQPHVAHIHGSLTGADAQCPSTRGDDANHDGFLSVFEGAPKYGPIKLNLTEPQTPFGPNANATLFAPFAGTPNLGDFPQVGKNGQFKLNTTYSFDLAKTADQQAYESLRRLDKQHIVIHGAYAPQSVDTAGGSNMRVYDPLLPVACGEIRVVGGRDGSQKVEMHMSPVNDKSYSHDTHNEHNEHNEATTTSATTTNVHVSNHTPQSAMTGDAEANDDMGDASAQSGDAHDDSMATFTINLNDKED